jgi:hypothetical protein
LFFAGHEQAQPAANEFDFRQGTLAKFDLRLQSTNIPRHSAGFDKFAKAGLKSAERGLDETHSISYQDGILTLNEIQLTD